MPEISRFFGIVIKMYYGDHEAIININTLALVAGYLPHRALGLVAEWALLHQEELIQCWQKISSFQSPDKINPLE